jgi:hypothetical protein
MLLVVQSLRRVGLEGLCGGGWKGIGVGAHLFVSGGAFVW